MTLIAKRTFIVKPSINNDSIKNTTMAVGKYKVGIEITDTPETVQKLGNLVQFAINNVDHQDMISLMTKVKANPSLVKKALKFI